MELADALRENHGLITLDLTSNTVSKQWFLPDTYLYTRKISRMPTLRTSLDRNKDLLNDPATGYRYTSKPPIMDPMFDGEWTNRRKWKQINRVLEMQKVINFANAEEEKRMNMEKDAVFKEITEIMQYYTIAIDLPNNSSFVNILAKLISDYYHDISKLDSDSFTADMKALIDPKIRQEDPSHTHVDKKQLKPFTDDFRLTQNAIISIVFKSFNVDVYSMYLHPESLEQLCNHICLPIHPNDMQTVVDGTLIPERSMIGFYKFIHYITSNASNIIKNNYLQRYRVLSDLYFK